MLRTVLRRPSPAAIFALLVLVVIAAPLADAAQEAVKNPKARAAAEKKKTKKVVRAQFADKAKFADNAGKIRGYSVGFAALPSRVVLTGPNGKLPAAVIPDGVGKAGPAGPAGPTGPSGGFSQVRIVFVQGNAGTEGVSTATAACGANEKVTGGGHELVYPVRAGAATGPVEIEFSKPVVVNAAAGTSGWSVQAVRIPNQFTYDGTNVVPDPSPDKLVVVKAWAVCTSR
jgi:hypothetical protein